MHDGKSTYRKNPNIAWRNIADEAVLVPMAKVPGDVDAAYVLNVTGARIWDLLDGTHSLEAIARTISEEYEIDQAQAGVDLQEILERLLSLNAVEQISK